MDRGLTGRTARAELVAELATEIRAMPGTHVRRVAVDGVDGAGKTHFADELAAELAMAGTSVIRASADGFHRPRERRHRRGRASPEGYFRDSYDYVRMTRLLLDPLSPGGTGQFVRQVHDVHAERAVVSPVERAAAGSVLVFDGIFAHRDELVDRWDFSIWLEVPFAVSIPRGARRGYGHPDPDDASNVRYVEGQRLYLAECAPRARATVVVDNTDLARPVRLPG